MIFCSNTKNALYFSSVKDIPTSIWEGLNCVDSFYTHPNYLTAIEKNHQNIRFAYVVLLDSNKKPIAFAVIQIIDFYLDGIKNNLELLVKRIKNIGRKFGVIPKKKSLKLLIAGNTFVSGEHGIYINQSQDKKLVIKQLAKSILHFVNTNKTLKGNIDGFLLKDFVDSSLFITNELRYYNYHPFSVEPNMQLKISKNWTSFDDYLQAMKTKFRVKARKAFKQSASLRIEEITAKTIDNFLPQMTSLYKKVADSASFNLGNFNLNTYKDLKENLQENYSIKCYFLNDKMVGFLSGMINGNSLDAHFVGIDYEFNRTYAIYQRMLYDYINIAIERKLDVLNFGRTASEIKSSVGATPQNLTMYLRHRKSLTNKLLKLFLQHVQPTPFHQKYPFKKL